MEISESDWKILRKLLPLWQEAYMEKLCREYTALLTSGDDAAEKFWELEKRIRHDKKSAGVCVNMSRSQAMNNIFQLLNERAITRADLSEFSQHLQDVVDYLYGL